MHTKPITSYKNINSHFDQVRLFSQNHLFLNFLNKVGFHVHKYHKNIHTYQLASRVINHNILVSQSSFNSQNSSSPSFFLHVLKSLSFLKMNHVNPIKQTQLNTNQVGLSIWNSQGCIWNLKSTRIHHSGQNNTHTKVHVMTSKNAQPQ